MQYLDWRPVSAEALMPRVVRTAQFDFNIGDQRDSFSSALNKCFPKNTSFAKHTFENINKLSYAMRTDGLFVFSFVKKSAAAVTDEEISAFLSYVIKSLHGHIHHYDESPLDGRRYTELHRTLALHRPIHIPGGFAVKSTLRNKLTDKSLKTIKSKSADSLLKEELAILHIRRNFSDQFDVAHRRVAEINSQRNKLSYLCGIFAAICTLFLMRVVGYARDTGDWQTVLELLLYRPLAMISLITAIIGVVVVIAKLLGPSAGKSDKSATQATWPGTQHLANSIEWNYNRYRPTIEKFLYSNCAINNVVLFFFTFTAMTLIPENWLNWFFYIFSENQFKVPSTLDIWHFNRPSPVEWIMASGVAILLTVIHYAVKIRRFRRQKMITWDKCFGYLSYGGIFTGIAAKILGIDRVNYGTVYEDALNIVQSKYHNERRKYLVDVVAAAVVFIIITLVLVSSVASYQAHYFGSPPGT